LLPGRRVHGQLLLLATLHGHHVNMAPIMVSHFDVAIALLFQLLDDLVSVIPVLPVAGEFVWAKAPPESNRIVPAASRPFMCCSLIVSTS